MITLTREANGNTLHFNKYEKWLTICLLVYWHSGFRGQEEDSGLKNLSLNTYVSFALKLNFDLKEHNKNKSTQYNIETENWISFCKAVRYSSLIKYNFKNNKITTNKLKTISTMLSCARLHKFTLFAPHTRWKEHGFYKEFSF